MSDSCVTKRPTAGHSFLDAPQTVRTHASFRLRSASGSLTFSSWNSAADGQRRVRGRWGGNVLGSCGSRSDCGARRPVPDYASPGGTTRLAEATGSPCGSSPSPTASTLVRNTTACRSVQTTQVAIGVNLAMCQRLVAGERAVCSLTRAPGRLTLWLYLAAVVPLVVAPSIVQTAVSDSSIGVVPGIALNATAMAVIVALLVAAFRGFLTGRRWRGIGGRVVEVANVASVCPGRGDGGRLLDAITVQREKPASRSCSSYESRYLRSSSWS